ncbi:MAG: DUF2442 domain-containing protein [Litorimonas sp.]
MRTITQIKLIGPHRLAIVFDDGRSGVWQANPADYTKNMAKPLADPAFFARACIIPQFGGLEWPNGYDASPDWIFLQIEAAGMLDDTHEAAE